MEKATIYYNTMTILEKYENKFTSNLKDYSDKFNLFSLTFEIHAMNIDKRSELYIYDCTNDCIIVDMYACTWEIWHIAKIMLVSYIQGYVIGLKGAKK